MAGKKLGLARLMMTMGVDRLIRKHVSASLLVLNYHRIRDPGRRSTSFDDGVFDTDFDTFRRQMRWLKSATLVLDEEGLLKLGSDDGREPSRGTIYTAVTFDDGYIDCFRLVKPVLDEMGIRGIFFIPVEILESRKLGWWDLAAYMLKRTKNRSISIDDRSFHLGENVSQSLRRIHQLFKLEKAERTADLLTKLSNACGVSPPAKDEQSAELMEWSQVCELRAAGHAIGSHAWSHRPLATLEPDAQAREILDSRRELEAIVGTSIASFAYPVGGPRHFNEHSVDLVRKAGYDQAFTFNTGNSSLPIIDRFRIPRESATSIEVLKAKALLPGVMGIQERRAV